MEEHTCPRLNTCEESLQTRRIAWALMKRAQEVLENCEDVTSQPGVEVPTEPRREPEELVRDDFDDGMDTVEQWTPPEGSGGTVSSTEIGGQSIW